MPYRYEIDRSRGVVHVERWGELSRDEIVDSYRAIRADERFEPGFRQLSDMRGVLGCDLDGEAVRELSELKVFDRCSRRAFVVSTDVSFGVLRMYQAWAELGERVVHVFRDPREAERWLSGADA